ncbi:lipoprotein, partial [mine drainage metagenome]
VIGASAGGGGNLTDIGVAIPAQACPLKTALQFPSTPNQFSLATPNIGSIEQVLVSPNSRLGFVTFVPASATGSNNTLPAYQIPCTQHQASLGACPAGQTTVGKVINVSLTGKAGAPLAGVFSPDTNTFYVSTTGDDLVHFIDTANVNALTDTQQVNPRLTCDVTTTA